MSNDFAWLGAAEIAALIRDRKASAVEVMQATLARAERAQAALNCFITICGNEALRDAMAADEAVARGDDLGPLHGVPLHVKDLVNTKGVRTTFASLMYEHNIPAADAVSVARLKAAGAIVVERRSSVDDVLPRMVELYAATRARSDLQFETLPPAYFTGVLSGAGEGASCFLYWHGPELLAFNLVLHDDRRLVDKFFCMNAEQGRRFNLYFLSWMTNVRFCLERGIKLFVSGQAAYGPKLRLGSKLNPNWLFFRHRNRLIHAALRLVAAFLRVDRHDPVLSTLAKDRDAVPGEWRGLQHP